MDNSVPRDRTTLITPTVGFPGRSSVPYNGRISHSTRGRTRQLSRSLQSPAHNFLPSLWIPEGRADGGSKIAFTHQHLLNCWIYVCILSCWSLSVLTGNERSRPPKEIWPSVMSSNYTHKSGDDLSEDWYCAKFTLQMCLKNKNCLESNLDDLLL